MNRAEMVKRLEAGESPWLLVREKWTDIRDGKGKDKGARNCAFCMVYDFYCQICPVVMSGGVECDSDCSLYARYVNAENPKERREAVDEIIEFVDSLIEKEVKEN